MRSIVSSIVAVSLSATSVIAATERSQSSQASQNSQNIPIPSQLKQSSQQPQQSGPRDLNAAKEMGKFLVIDSARITESDSTYREALKALITDLRTCHLSVFTGPLCLNSSYGILEQIQFSRENSFVFLTVIQQKSSGMYASLVVTIAKDIRSRDPVQLEVAVTKNKYSADSIKNAYLSEDYSNQVSFTVPADAGGAVWKRLVQAKDTQTLYHAAAYFFHSKRLGDNRELLANELRRQVKLITREAKAPYAMAFAKMLRMHMSSSRDLMLLLGSEWMVSDDNAVSELGAITLAENGMNNDRLRNKVVGAMKSTDASTRLIAVKALSKLSVTKRDENVLLEMLSDSSPEVRAAVGEMIGSIRLDNTNLLSVQGMMRDKNPETRLAATKLLGKITTSESTAMLIEAMADTAPVVRAAAKAAVSGRRVTQREMPALQRQLLMANPSIRQGAIEMLSTIDLPEVKAILIPMMYEEPAEARDVARKAITSRHLDDSDLEQLRPFLNNLDDGYRQWTVSLISKIGTRAANSLLVPMMFDQKFEVREESRRLLKDHVFDSRDVESLKPYLSNANPAYGHFAVTLIGKIQGSEAQRVLIPLMFDDVTQIRDEARALIARRTLSNADLDSFRTYIEDADPNTRTFAVANVARIVSDEATTLLITKITDEAFDVRTQAINSLSGRRLNSTHIATLEEFLAGKNKVHRVLAVKALSSVVSKDIETLLIERLIEEGDSEVQMELRKGIQDIRVKLKQKRVGSAQGK